jgi:hypothetical protein
MCATRTGVEVPAAPAGDGAVELAFDVATPDLPGLAGGPLRVEHIRASGASGVTDLGFVAAAQVTAAGAPVVACDGDCTTDGELYLVSDARIDPAGATLPVDVAIQGALPEIAWTMDVEVCVRSD